MLLCGGVCFLVLISVRVCCVPLQVTCVLQSSSQLRVPQVLFEPVIDVTESMRMLLVDRLEVIGKVMPIKDRTALAYHQIHFFTTMVERVRQYDDGV